MPLASKLFAVYGFALLLLAFSCEYACPIERDVTFHLGSRGYGFPPASVFIWLAALSCSFAAVYSLWMLPFSKTVALWHFGITATGTSLAIASGYRLFVGLPNVQPGTELSGANFAVALVQILSVPVVLLAQSIFVVNLFYAIARKH